MTEPSDDEICDKVAELLEVKRERCRPDAPLTELVSDSFRLVEMAIEIQDDYGIVFGQDDMKKLVNVGDLAVLVRSKL